MTLTWREDRGNDKRRMMKRKNAWRVHSDMSWGLKR